MKIDDWIWTQKLYYKYIYVVIYWFLKKSTSNNGFLKFKKWTNHLVWTLQNGKIIIDIYFKFFMGTQHDFEGISITRNLG
jgi:hypothetical protein